MGSEGWLLGSIIQSQKNIEGVLVIIGLCYTIKLVLTHAWDFILASRIYFFEPLFGRERNWVRDYGSWAVITGATDGIGKEYALQLASKGMNVVLISRSLEKLKRVALEIITKYGVETKVIVADFRGDISIYNDIAKELAKVEVGLLVNNVGIFPPFPMHLTEMEPQSTWEQVTVNVGAVTVMTRLVLPQMMERKKGGIINLASAASACPTPLMCIYGAAKMYMKHFSEAIRDDYSKHGITVQCLVPYYIATNLTSFSDQIGKPAFNVPTSERYVRSALRTFGIAHTTTGYLMHAMQYTALVQLLPIAIYKKVVHLVQLQYRADALANLKNN